MKRNILLIGLVILFASSQLLAQSERDLFEAGLQAYKNGRYRAAQEQFLSAIQQYPEGRLSTATRLMLAKSYYKLKDYGRAEVVCKYFFTKHLRSAYLDDMHHLLGNIYFQLGKYEDAVQEWLWVIQHSKDPRLKRRDGEYIFHTMEYYLDEQQITRLRREHPNSVFQGLVNVLLAKKMLQTGQEARAKTLLRQFLREQPNHFYADEARRMLGAPVAESLGRKGFLYLKPSSGESRQVAEEIEQGLAYAIREYRQRYPGEEINLQVAEVEPTVVSAISVASELIENSDPLCIIGPINSDQCAAVSLLSRYEGRPYIIPLSSQTGLARVSPYAFQINPDAQTKGRFLGRYAVEKLGVRRVAILAPVNEYGESFVQSFTEEIQAGGSEIANLQWYYENSQDFTRQFRAIWRTGVYLTFQDSVLQEHPDMSDEELKTAYKEYLDLKFEPARVGSRIDSTDLPATGIDAVLMVIRSSQFIEYMAPQIAFNNIRATILGNEGWNDPPQLRKYKDHLEGMVYITAGYFDPNSTNYKVFMNRFRSQMNTTPELYQLLGYDIMKWVLTNYKPGMTREKLRDRLENTTLYQGILESIQFNSTPRVNDKLTVLKLYLGQILKLE